MIGVLPIALVLQRFPVAKALSALIFVRIASFPLHLQLVIEALHLQIWGVIVMLTVVVTNYQGAIAQRFFLGLVESAVSPGFVLGTYDNNVLGGGCTNV